MLTSCGFFTASSSLTIPDRMRSRDRIIANLESIYREAFERAKADEAAGRMVELDNAFTRDQLMMEVLLDIRDLLAAPRRG